MIDDGIINAAAFAGADLSVAMCTGSDAATANSEIVVIYRDLDCVIDAMNFSPKAPRII